DPRRRYQTAAELRDDLQRQLEHRPLQFAAEPSLGERARKWARRHPRLTSSTGVGAIAALLMLVLASALLLRLHHLARRQAEQEAQRTSLEAAAALQQLREGLKTAEILLGSNLPDVEREQLDEGTALGHTILQHYGVLDNSSWPERPLARALQPEQKEELRQDLGELLLLLAKGAARQARIEEALRLNALAEGCFFAGTVPPALWRQRAELVRQAGNAEEAQRL